MKAPPPHPRATGARVEQYQMERELEKLEKHYEGAKRLDLPSLNFSHFLHEVIEGVNINLEKHFSDEKANEVRDTAHILLEAMGESRNPSITKPIKTPICEPYSQKELRSSLAKIMRSHVDNFHIRKIEGTTKHNWLNGGHRYLGRAIKGNPDTRYKPRAMEALLATNTTHNLMWLTCGNTVIQATQTYREYFDDNDLINELNEWNRSNQISKCRKWLPCESHDGFGVTQGTHGFFVDPKISTWRSPFNHIWEYDTDRIEYSEFIEVILTDIFILLLRESFTPLFVDRSTLYGLDSKLGLLKLKIKSSASHRLDKNDGDPLKQWNAWNNFETVLSDGGETMTDLFTQAWLILHTPRSRKDLGAYLPLCGIASLSDDTMDYQAWVRGYNQFAKSFPFLYGMTEDPNNKYNWERTFARLRHEYKQEKQIAATLKKPQSKQENVKQTYAMLFLRSAMQQESYGLTESYSRSVALGEAERYRLNPTTLVEAIGVHTEGERITQRKCWWLDNLKAPSADIHYNYITGRTTEPTEWGETMTETKMEDATRTTEFIPSWKDNRPPKLVNVNGAPPKGFNHYEVRCEKCNGRVTLSTPSGGLKTKVKCPHCKTHDIEVET